jgi:hypothetical protein
VGKKLIEDRELPTIEPRFETAAEWEQYQDLLESRPITEESGLLGFASWMSYDGLMGRLWFRQLRVGIAGAPTVGHLIQSCCLARGPITLICGSDFLPWSLLDAVDHWVPRYCSLRAMPPIKPSCEDLDLSQGCSIFYVCRTLRARESCSSGRALLDLSPQECLLPHDRLFAILPLLQVLADRLILPSTTAYLFGSSTRVQQSTSMDMTVL